jgi:hypothetical protein
MSAPLVPGATDIRGLAAAVPVLVELCNAAQDDAVSVAVSGLAIECMLRLCDLPSRSVAEASCKADLLAHRLGDFENLSIGRAECALAASLARDLRALAEGGLHG